MKTIILAFQGTQVHAYVDGVYVQTYTPPDDDLEVMKEVASAGPKYLREAWEKVVVGTIAGSVRAAYPRYLGMLHPNVAIPTKLEEFPESAWRVPPMRVGALEAT